MKLVENIKISKELQYHIDNNLPLNENVFRPNSEKYFQLFNEVRELFNDDKIRLTEDDIFLVESDLGKKVKLSNGETIWLDAPIEEELISETIKLDIKVGDTLMGGKFKNKKVVVKTIDTNEKGDITINGSPLLRFRLVKEGRDIIEDYYNNMLSEAEYKGKNVELNKPTRSSGPKKYQVYVKNPSTGNIKKVSFGDAKGGLTAKVSNPKARKAFAARHNCKDKKDKTKAGYWACRANRFANLWNGQTYPGFW
jgi:hypothetical protein